MKNKKWKDYKGQCEYFAVYCPENRGTYLVPVNQVGATQAVLRMAPTINKQEKSIRWAKDYEI